MTRELWINPALGVAGDMLLGALHDAGADPTRVREALDALDTTGWHLDFEVTSRAGIRCVRAVVETQEQPAHRSWSSIDAALAVAPLDARVAEGARATFRALAVVEANRHGVGVDDVHFHEVGALDALVDIVGCWAALCSLEVDTVSSAAVGLGHGTVGAAHGRLPLPAPATVDLLVGVPVSGLDAAMETTTPTGAALLTTMVDRWGPPPNGTITASGYGAGSNDPDTHPNVVHVVVLESDNARDDRSRVDTAVVLETNVDDVTPEVLGHLVTRLIEAGADDAWIVPIVMKKTRPAHQLGVVCRPDLAVALTDLIAVETGTLGLRSHSVDKRVYERDTGVVVVDGHRIQMKIGPHGAKPEHDDLVECAASTGRSIRSLANEAMGAWAAMPTVDNSLENSEGSVVGKVPLSTAEEH